MKFETLFMQLIIALCVGILVWQSAKRRGMSYRVWGVVCAMVPLLGLIFLFVRSPLKIQQSSAQK